MICPGIEKMNAKFRKTITVGNSLVVALWQFSTANTYRAVIAGFDIAKLIVIKTVQEVRCEIVCVSTEFIKLPL